MCSFDDYSITFLHTATIYGKNIGKKIVKSSNRDVQGWLTTLTLHYFKE